MRYLSDFVAASLGVLILASAAARAEAPDPEALLEKVVEEAGGLDALHRRKAVEYVYLYRRGETGTLDVSLERYVFDGEKSWARYELAENLSPEREGEIVQGYDGTSSWQTIDGERVTDPAQLKRADFLRKTNFYWFAMTFKLLDPGVRYTHEGRRDVDGTSYELVKLTFEPGVGDVADTYLLYVDPKTWRIDRFLFTVLDFGKKEPFLMEVDYERVDGVLLPTKRRYAPADWSGTVKEGASWTHELSVGVRFTSGFDDALFALPRRETESP